MTPEKPIITLSCHAEGEVGDVIIGGVDPPPGRSVWEQRTWIASDKRLRNFMLNEPRGGVFRHVNLLVPPMHPDADIGFIVMEPEHTPPMSGSNSICVSTVVLETGLVDMHEPETTFTLEAPGGLVQVHAQCRNGKAERITVRNVPSFADKLNASIEVEGHGTLTVDTAFGGDSFVIVDASALGFSIEPDEARDLSVLGARITAAANEQLGFSHPEQSDWNHLSFCEFAMPLTRDDEGRPVSRNAVVIDPGKLDRSPCGTGASARMAVLHAKGELKVGDTMIARSIIGSRFDLKLVEETKIGDKVAIVPTISGRAWVTGRHEHYAHPTDPWPEGYRLTDTWPKRT